MSSAHEHGAAPAAPDGGLAGSVAASGGGLAEFGHGLIFLVELGEQFVFDQAERRGQALAGKPSGGA